MTPHLPSSDLDLANLTRRQAAVFEHLCIRAAAGIQAEIGMHDYAASELELGSESVKREHATDAKRCRRELDRVHALKHRLTKLRSAPLTAEERARLGRARDLKPDLTAEEAQLVIYGMLPLDDLEAVEREAA